MRCLLLLMLVFISSCTEPLPEQAPVETNSVRIMAIRFEPKIIKIKVGTTVTWTMDGVGYHNVVWPGFRSPFLNKQGESWSHKFDETGRITYFCEPHSAMGMTGTIIVE